jgi:hypothetical protein
MCKKDGQCLSFIFTVPPGEKIKIVYGKNYTEIKEYGNLLHQRKYISVTHPGGGVRSSHITVIIYWEKKKIILYSKFVKTCPISVKYLE